MSSSVSNPVVNPGAMGLYSQQLGLMTQNYGNILNGYQNAQGNIGNTLGGIYGGYDQLQKSVNNTLGVSGGGWGVAAPAARDINSSFVETQGRNQQALISAGLGNSSLLAQSNNQANSMAGRAYASLGSQLASTAAGYQSQIGLSRQAAQMQGLGMQTNLTQSYLGNLAGYNFRPSVDLYGQSSSSSSPNPYGGGGGGSGGGSGTGGWGDQAWANRYGSPNAMGYQGGYANPGFYQPPYGGGGYGQPIMPGYETGFGDMSDMFGDSGSGGDF